MLRMFTILDMIWKFFMDLFVSTKARGELTVTGADEARFDLTRNPEYISVEFADEDCTPCDPGSDDELDYEVHSVCCEHKCHHKCHCCHKHKRWELVIRWKVSGLRKIVWEACS